MTCDVIGRQRLNWRKNQIFVEMLSGILTSGAFGAWFILFCSKPSWLGDSFGIAAGSEVYVSLGKRLGGGFTM